LALVGLQQAWLSDYFQKWFEESRNWSDAFDIHALGTSLFGFVCAVASHAWIQFGERKQARVGEYFGLLLFFGGLYLFCFCSPVFGSRRWEGYFAWELVSLGVFVLALLMIFRATRLGDRTHQINLGLLFVGLIIVSTYLRLVGTMMKTGVVFLTTGALILG